MYDASDRSIDPGLAARVEELERKIAAGMKREPPAVPPEAGAAGAEHQQPAHAGRGGRQEVDRAPEVLERRLREHEQRLQSLRSYRVEYEDLRSTLGELPKRTQHQIMVPLNSVAFMPGRLEHTNEVTVLLGDNYFAERSASQAQDVLTRRIGAVDKLIEEQEAQVDAILDKKFTAERLRDQLANLGRSAPDGKGNAKPGGRLKEVDIHEAYDDPPAPAPAPSHRTPREPQPEPELEPGADPEDAVSATDHMYGLSTAEYVDLLQEMEREELLSACEDFGLRLRRDSSKPPTEKGLRQLLRRHLLRDVASSSSDSKTKEAGQQGLKGGFFDKPRNKRRDANSTKAQPTAILPARQQKDTKSESTRGVTAPAAVAPRTSPEHQQQAGVGGVVERFDKSAGQWVSSSDEGTILSRSITAAAVAADAETAAEVAAAAAPRRVSKFKAAREQAKAQAQAQALGDQAK